jgi:hypothetical protein
MNEQGHFSRFECMVDLNGSRHADFDERAAISLTGWDRA